MSELIVVQTALQSITVESTALNPVISTNPEQAVVVIDNEPEIVVQGPVPRGAQGPPGPSGVSFSATCTISESVGDLVTVTGAGPTVSKTDIDSGQKADGIIVSKSSDTDCEVQASGVITVVGVTAGVVYFVGETGQLEAGPPSVPVAGTRVFQVVGKGLDADTLLLGISTQPVVRRSP